MLKRLFEHLGDANYDYGACADSVTWLEAHGIAGIRSLEAVLDRLLAKNHVPTEIVSSEPDHFTINAGGQTLFAIGPVAVDLGASMLSRSSPFRITITNAVNPSAMVAGIHRGRRYPGSMAAWWRSTDEPILHLVRGGANCEYPEYQRFQLSADEEYLPGSVTLVCSTVFSELNDHIPDTAALDCLETIGTTEFANRYAQILDSGIEVDEGSFNSLCEVADRVLVESTDTSRSGAGE